MYKHIVLRSLHTKGNEKAKVIITRKYLDYLNQEPRYTPVQCPFLCFQNVQQDKRISLSGAIKIQNEYVNQFYDDDYYTVMAHRHMNYDPKGKYTKIHFLSRDLPGVSRKIEE